MMKFLAALLVLATVLFAQTGQIRPRILAFEEGDDEVAFGVLAGINRGSGYGVVPLVWDRAAFGGMFSFGAEARLYWQKYERWNRWWNSYYDPYLGWIHNAQWWRYGRDQYGEYHDYRLNGVPVYRQYINSGHRIALDNFGNPVGTWLDYTPYNSNLAQTYTRFGINPNFRFMFHPLGMPSLRGKVAAAKSIDPYAGIKMGFSLTFWDKDDPVYFGRKSERVKFDFPEFNCVTGLRWYFREHRSLWTEISLYDFSLGFSFNF